MLSNISIENFRCLRSVNVPLRPLTILIGPNDTGKSAFLAAIAHLASGNDAPEIDHWRHDPQAKIKIAGATQSGMLNLPSIEARERNLANVEMRQLQPFHLPSQGVLMESAGQSDDEGPPVVEDDGKNVASLFDYLLRRDRKQFFAAVEALRKLVPGLDDIEIATPHPGIRRLDLIIERGLRIQASQASAGVRLLIAFVALAYHPAPPKTILIEEPETGIHPKRLNDVLQLLREITEGKHGGNAAQVILTTHSPYLLDLIDLNRDQVLVFSREENGSRTVEPADEERLRLFLDEFLLGEVWFNQGEKGLVARH